MTTKADFTPEEWDAVLQGPPTAGMIVLTAQSGGTFKETWAISHPLPQPGGASGRRPAAPSRRGEPASHEGDPR
jgi:hypothetical protein